MCLQSSMTVTDTGCMSLVEMAELLKQRIITRWCWLLFVCKPWVERLQMRRASSIEHHVKCFVVNWTRRRLSEVEDDVWKCPALTSKVRESILLWVDIPRVIPNLEIKYSGATLKGKIVFKIYPIYMLTTRSHIWFPLLFFSSNIRQLFFNLLTLHRLSFVSPLFLLCFL
jgi:hypothetical protein